MLEDCDEMSRDEKRKKMNERNKIVKRLKYVFGEAKFSTKEKTKMCRDIWLNHII